MYAPEIMWNINFSHVYEQPDHMCYAEFFYVEIIL